MHHISNYLFFIDPIAAALPFLASLTIFIQAPGERYLTYFALFTFINFLMDSTTSFMAYYHINNVVLTNINDVVVILFDLFILRKIVYSKRAKRVALVFLIAYPVLFLIDTFLIQGPGVFASMTYAVGCLLIVTSCIYYFWELFQQKTSVNLVRQPAFWICSGLMFYFACTFPLLGLVNFLDRLPLIILQNLLQILLILNVFQYLSFTIAFLCRLKLRRSM